MWDERSMDCPYSDAGSIFQIRFAYWLMLKSLVNSQGTGNIQQSLVGPECTIEIVPVGMFLGVQI